MPSLLRDSRLVLAAFCLLAFTQYVNASGGVVVLNENNIDETLASNELVFINFYADWCRFSNMLQPIFEEAALKVNEIFTEPGRVVMGKVDCDKEGKIASRFHITKYPTLKIVRNGQPLKREYRGQRSVEAFIEFIKTQLKDPVKEYHNLTELKNIDKKKRVVVGYFIRKESQEYELFRRVASNLKDDCQFYAGFGDASREMHPPGQPIIVFKPDTELSNEHDETYLGSMSSYDELNTWAQGKCVPLVREITFENAEELTEEGLPFLILFHHPADIDNVKLFKDVVSKSLIPQKQNFNFLTADGERFAHPLHHLSKSLEDLPVIAIDSFRHMYLLPDFKNMSDPDIAGKLHKFAYNLLSGKLHREYHYGPDSTDSDSSASKDTETTTPPESSFKKLAPSKNRYTILRDEL